MGFQMVIAAICFVFMIINTVIAINSKTEIEKDGSLTRAAVYTAAVFIIMAM